MTRRVPRGGEDGGLAVLEVLVLGTALLVPLVYLVLAVVSVQQAAYAVTSAAREAARAYVDAGTVAEARTRADATSRLVLADAGLHPGPSALAVRCAGGACLTPGSRVEATVTVAVDLPFLPAGPTVTVRGVEVMPVDPYRDQA